MFRTHEMFLLDPCMGGRLFSVPRGDFLQFRSIVAVSLYDICKKFPEN